MDGDGFESLPMYSSVKASRNSGWFSSHFFHPSSSPQTNFLFSCTPTLALFYPIKFDLFISPMALARIPLPSFTLVLTSGSHSFHEYPTAIKMDSSVSPVMFPTAPDYLMKTIDLRGEQDDSIQTPLNMPTTRIDHGCIRLETILEEEEGPSTSPAIKKQIAMSPKQYALMLLQSLRCKLSSAKNIGSVPL